MQPLAKHFDSHRPAGHAGVMNQDFLLFFSLWTLGIILALVILLLLLARLRKPQPPPPAAKPKPEVSKLEFHRK